MDHSDVTRPTWFRQRTNHGDGLGDVEPLWRRGDERITAEPLASTNQSRIRLVPCILTIL